MLYLSYAREAKHPDRINISAGMPCFYINSLYLAGLNCRNQVRYIFGKEFHRHGEKDDTEELAHDIHATLADHLLDPTHVAQYEIDNDQVEKCGNDDVHNMILCSEREQGRE